MRFTGTLLPKLPPSQKGPSRPRNLTLKIAASILKPVFLVPNSLVKRKGKVVYLGGFLKA